DNDNALVLGGLDDARHQGIARAGERQVEYLGALLGRPVHALDHVEGRAVLRLPAGGEGTDIENARLRRYAVELILTADRAGHARSVRVRLEVPADGVERFGDHAFQFGVFRVGAGVDQGDQNAV